MTEIKLHGNEIKTPVTARLTANSNLFIAGNKLEKGKTYIFDSKEFSQWSYKDHFEVIKPVKEAKK